MKQKRIEYIDGIKAFAIILVIIGHCYWKNSILGLTQVIYSFHMPLFFIISGFFVKSRRFKESICYSFHAYLIPYLYASLIIGIMYLLDNDIKNVLLSVIFCSGNPIQFLGHNILPVGPIWFLTALFWSNVINSYIINKVANEYHRFFIIISLFIISHLTSKFLILPFAIQLGTQSSLFVFLGNIIYKNINTLRCLVKNRFIFLLMLLAWGGELLSGSIYMSSFNYGFPFFGILGSICICILIIFFFSNYNIKGFGVGKNTLYILVFHNFYICYCFQYGFPFKTLNYMPKCNFIIESIVTIIVTFVIVSVFVSLKKIKRKYEN